MCTNRWAVTAAALVAACGLLSPARADIVIIGGLGNFDCPNREGDDCNGFEIELEGPEVGDCFHTYHNGNYGSPTISPLPDRPGIRVVYENPSHATHAGVIEHFGVSLNGRHPVTAQRFRWRLGTVTNPNDPPPPPLPPPPPPLALPHVRVELVTTPTGDVIRETVENVDPLGRLIWVQRRETVATRQVTLEELMPDDPLIVGANPLDVEMVTFGVPLITEEPAPSPGDTESEVVAYEVYANVRQMVGGELEDAPGPMIGNILTAQITQGTACQAAWLPIVTADPQDTVALFDGAADFDVSASASPSGGDVLYQWQHEGVDLEGEDSAHLNVDPVTLASAGQYRCIITNDCGFVASVAATLTVHVPIAIEDQPDQARVCPGTIARFRVTADTLLAPSYEWRRNGVPIDVSGTHATASPGPGGMSSTLVVRNVSAADLGQYSVRIFNEFETVTSRSVGLSLETGCAPACDPDVNQDGNADQDDVAYLINVIGGGSNPTNVDPDFNHDGNADQDDVAALIDVVAGGNCP